MTGSSALPEGAEPPPPGVHTMAAVRWAIIALLALAALYSATLLPRASTPSVATAEVWQCPMHPRIIQDHPGQCPICHMDLVKVDAHAHAPERGDLPELATITISQDRLQRIGVRTQTARSGMLAETVQAVGVVMAPES